MPTRLARAATLLVSLFLAACATQPDSSRSTGTENPIAPADSRPDAPSAKPLAPGPDWPAIRTEFTNALRATGMDATVESDGSLKLTLTTDSVFGSGSANIRPAFQATLDKLAATLHSHPHTSARIVGHTDSVGSEMTNQDLSARRADAVMSHLIGRGIPFTRLSAEGQGEARPIADNGTDSGRARNRRVEIYIVPQTPNTTPGRR